MKARALAAAMLLTIAAAPAGSAMRIYDDPGGQIGPYLDKYQALRRSGERVEIDGLCASACTMLLGSIPPDRICVTPRAVLEFHSAWNPTASGGQASSAAGQTHVQAHVQAHIKGAQPYVTSGLTPMEVLSALGKPTSSTGEKMMYGTSEIYFKNGQVSGWKIDAGSPIRVKLWADSAPAPGLTTFGAGSTKSDVIALQGTPNLFSENEFGYGTSLVFFQNNRVVSWKEDPTSVRLRVPH